MYSGSVSYPELSYNPARGVVTQEVHNYTMKLLAQAKAVATAAQQPPSSPVDSTTQKGNGFYFNYAPTRNSFFSSSRTTVINNNYTSNRSSDDDDDDNNDTAIRVIAGIIGVAALAIGAIVLGRSQVKNEQLQAKIKKFEKQVNKWEIHRQCYAYVPTYEKQMNKIIVLTKELMQRNQNNLLDLIYKVAIPVLIGGGLLVGGAITGAAVGSAVMAAGAITLVGVGTYGIYKAVKRCYDETDEEIAQKILDKMHELEKSTYYQSATRHFAINEPQYIY